MKKSTAIAWAISLMALSFCFVSCTSSSGQRPVSKAKDWKLSTDSTTQDYLRTAELCDSVVTEMILLSPSNYMKIDSNYYHSIDLTSNISYAITTRNYKDFNSIMGSQGITVLTANRDMLSRIARVLKANGVKYTLTQSFSGNKDLLPMWRFSWNNKLFLPKQLLYQEDEE